MSDEYLIDPDAPTTRFRTGHVDGCEGWYQLNEQRNAGRIDARRYGAIASRTPDALKPDWTAPWGSDALPELDGPIDWDIDLFEMLREMGR